jgi:gas vesicle protein
MVRVLDDTMNATRSMIDSARENTAHAMESAREGAEHAVASTRSVVFDGFRAVADVIAMLRHLDGDQALGWVGLARRRSPLHTVALVTAGMAVGAAVGMLLAPMSGEKLRAMVLDQLRSATGQPAESRTEVATTAPAAEKQVEESLADRAGDGVMQARQQHPNRTSSRQPS